MAARQTPIENLAQKYLAHAMRVAAQTPAVAAHLQDFNTWASQASPEQRDKQRQEASNPPPPVVGVTFFGGQHIPSRHIPGPTERIMPAHFLTSSGAFAEFPSVLISSAYQVSYILLETLTALGHDFIPVKVRPSRNPLGGKLFEPIGIATLYMSLSEGTEYQDVVEPFFVNFYVLNESPLAKGVFGILGKPEVEQVFGTLTPF